MRLALIGGGLTGSTVAREIQSLDLDLFWFEKSRGLGGQSSTRRSDAGRFDHGAPYFDAHSDVFRKQVDFWVQSGAVAPWNALRARYHEGSFIQLPAAQGRYVGIPGMNELCKAQAGEVPCAFGKRVSKVRHHGRTWSLSFDNGEPNLEVDALVTTAPAAQSWALMEGVKEYATPLQSVRSSSVWVAVVRLARFLNTDFEDISFDQGPLKKAVRNRTKPMREGADTWVLYGDPAWSKANMEREKLDAAQELKSIFESAMGPLGQMSAELVGHRWRYAQSSNLNVFEPVLCSEDRFLATGSYCFGSTIEGAWRAGQEAAQVIENWCKTGDSRP